MKPMWISRDECRGAEPYCCWDQEPVAEPDGNNDGTTSLYYELNGEPPMHSIPASVMHEFSDFRLMPGECVQVDGFVFPLPTKAEPKKEGAQ